MKINDFLKQENITAAELARRGKWTRATVHEWIHGIKRPSESNYEKLYKITKGKVSPSDFYDFALPINHKLTHSTKESTKINIST